MSDSDFGELAKLPEKCQERILSLALGLDRPQIPPRGAASIDQTVPPANDAHTPDSWGGLLSRGYMVSDSLIRTSQEGLKRIREECEACLSQSARPGAMGGGSIRWAESQARGDEITWLNLNQERRAGRENLVRLMESMNSFRQNLQDLGFQVDGKVSFQLARYPGNGARYARHKDASPSSPDRVITAICYLNQDWDAQVHGGQLCLYPKGASTSGIDPCVLVSPTSGRIVMFRSEMEHEVLPAFNARHAVTVWFKGAPSGLSVSTASTEPPCPPVENIGTSSQSGCIFVSIACYRDPECQWTISELFKKAEFPDLVHVGVVWQCKTGEDDGIMRMAGDQKWKHHVREIRLPHNQATGPCKARKLAESLWAGEEFVLQIDSHVRCTHKWDSKLKEMLAAAEAQSTLGNALLSSYPPNYEGEGPSATTSDETLPVLLCAESFDQDGMLRIAGRRLSQPHAVPIPSLFWAAGFSFSRSSLLTKVPYHDFPFLFFGEEISMLARIWTNGWDVFAPNSVVLFHQWSRKDRPTIWADGVVDEKVKRMSQQSIKDMLLGKVAPFGVELGSVRSIDEFWKHCGVRLAEKFIDEKGRWGGMTKSDFLD